MLQSNIVILKRWKGLNLPQTCGSIVLFSFIFHINSGLLESKLTMNNSSNAGDNPNVPPPKKTWKLSIDDKSSAITFPSEIFQFSWLVFDSPPKTNRLLFFLWFHLQQQTQGSSFLPVQLVGHVFFPVADGVQVRGFVGLGLLGLLFGIGVRMAPDVAAHHVAGQHLVLAGEKTSGAGRKGRNFSCVTQNHRAEMG